MARNKLLILDDDPLTGQTIRNIAALAGLDVELTASHKEFFRLLESWTPDVIALDLVMPEMDGVEVIAELGRRQSPSKIIITSGVGGRILDAAGRSAQERGLDIIGVLPKPFTPASLRELLAKCPPAGFQRKPLLPAGEESALHKLTAADLAQAIRKREIHVHYQPKVVCHTGVLSGFEALARWTHPVYGIIQPTEFIALAEANNLIDPLTVLIVEEALHWFRDFRAGIVPAAAIQHGIKSTSAITMSINISALSLSNVELFDGLIVSCQEYGVEPQSLIFELTETSAMRDPVTSLELLTRLRLRGFKLSIDDFGTGYSSMLQLVKLPFSEIKVDKSFVTTAKESEESRVVIKSIVSLAMSLGLIVTAEGIEDEETLLFLRNVGCNLVQGYHIARPMPGGNVLEWLQSRGSFSEERRLDALRSLRLLDTPSEERFDALVRLARRLLKMPMAAFSLIDSERLWFKSRSGVHTPALLRAGSFCTYTIEKGQVCVINDTLQHRDFALNPLVVNAPFIRFYAGCPVHAADGSNIGTLILLDTETRTLSPQQITTLQNLTHLVEKELYAKQGETVDEITRVTNQQAVETLVPEILSMCRRLEQNCTLHVFELINLAPGQVNEATRKNNYLLSAFARMLGECFTDVELLGRFERDKFLVLQVEADEKSGKLARWKLESAVHAHNHGNASDMEIRYRIGTVHTLPAQDYDLQSLLDKADQVMPPPF